jgi:CheY-like chemotaxis protein
MNLRCLIVDDEPNAVKLLEMFILQNTSWDQPAKCYDAREALTYLKTHPVDLIFLDINMPHLTGMEMATLLPPSVRIVFTTAYSEYAADSYGYPTIDYLLKPITLKRFYAALQKIEASLLADGSIRQRRGPHRYSLPHPTPYRKCLIHAGRINVTGHSRFPSGRTPGSPPRFGRILLHQIRQGISEDPAQRDPLFRGRERICPRRHPGPQAARLPAAQGHRRTTLRLLRPGTQFLYH